MVSTALFDSPSCNSSSFSTLIERCQSGCENARSELAEHVHEDLYKIAQRLCRGKTYESSMHATSLMNEAFLRMLKAGMFKKTGSIEHLSFVAAKTMRCVLADYLRSRMALKRSPVGNRVYLDQIVDQLAQQPFKFEALNDALDRLEATNPRQSRIVNFRFFLAMTVQETAEVLNISTSTVEKEWKQARLWLFEQLI